MTTGPAAMTLPELADRLAAFEDTVADTFEALGTSVQALQERATDAAGAAGSGGRGPRRWAERATAEDWHRLADWVDALNADYSLESSVLVPPCWPAHPGVVEELAGMWRAWFAAQRADEDAAGDGSAELAAWHDRWLWPALRRIHRNHYAISGCSPERHMREQSASKPSDRSLLPPAPLPVDETKTLG